MGASEVFFRLLFRVRCDILSLTLSTESDLGLYKINIHFYHRLSRVLTDGEILSTIDDEVQILAVSGLSATPQ